MTRLALFALVLLGTGAAAAGAELPADAPVIGVSFRGVTRAYPLSVFASGPVVSDVIARQEIVLFHDPAVGVTGAWFRTVLGEPIEFSGEAAGTVADDLTTITRWDLSTGRAVSGNLAGQRLVAVPIATGPWEEWRRRHPQAEVFSPEER